MVIQDKNSYYSNLISAINDIKTRDELNKEAEKLHNFFMTVRGKKFANTTIKKKSPNAQKAGPANKNNKDEIQGLYSSQRHRALQEILFGPTLYCGIDPNTIEKRYRSLLSTRPDCNISDLPPFLWQNTTSSEKDNADLEKKITSGEVKMKLRSKINNILYNSRSVGLDRLTYNDLLKSDPDCTLLTAFFNACLRLQVIPDIWKSLTYSVLVKETEDDPNDIKNWRSVTMHSTVLKLFQAILTSRLITWAKSTNRLSATQKGFLLNNAACESSFILQESKSYAQKNGKDLVVAWLDFTNACDFVPQEAVLHALLRHSVPSSIRNIVQSMFQNAETIFRTKGDNPFTNSIQIVKGLPQGLPLNLILLDLVVEPILRNLAGEQNMFQIFNQKINHFAIPNELTLLAESATNLQNLLDSVEKITKAIGIKFNINKCFTYHYDSKKNETREDKFSFFGQKLQNLPEAKINEFFGVKQGLSIGQDGVPTIKEMTESIENIDSSALTEYQKLESVHIFIIPRVENCLRGLQNFDKNSLEEVDRFLQNKIKLWLHLPDETTAEVIVFHVSNMNMKTNVTFLPFLDLSYIMKIVHALKMLNSNDKIVKQIAYDSLTREVSEMMHKKKADITKDHLVRYLSGDLHIKNIKSDALWEMVRTATINLKMKINLSWIYNNNDNEIQLVIKSKSKKKKRIFTGDFRADVEQHLKNTLVNYYINDAKKKSPESVKDTKVIIANNKGSNNGSKKVITPIKPVLKTPVIQVPVGLQLSNFPVLYAS